MLTRKYKIYVGTTLAIWFSVIFLLFYSLEGGHLGIDDLAAVLFWNSPLIIGIFVGTSVFLKLRQKTRLRNVRSVSAIIAFIISAAVGYSLSFLALPAIFSILAPVSSEARHANITILARSLSSMLCMLYISVAGLIFGIGPGLPGTPTFNETEKESL